MPCTDCFIAGLVLMISSAFWLACRTSWHQDTRWDPRRDIHTLREFDTPRRQYCEVPDMHDICTGWRCVFARLSARGLGLGRPNGSALAT